MECETIIRNIINQVIGVSNDIKITDTSNLEEFGLDSINYVMLIVMIEDEFNICFPEDRINYLNFKSIADIQFIVEEILNEQ